VLSENVVLYHGQHNKDFNKGIYSYDGQKRDVRCVLTRIIEKGQNEKQENKGIYNYT